MNRFSMGAYSSELQVAACAPGGSSGLSPPDGSPSRSSSPRCCIRAMSSTCTTCCKANPSTKFSRRSKWSLGFVETVFALGDPAAAAAGRHRAVLPPRASAMAHAVATPALWPCRRAAARRDRQRAVVRVHPPVRCRRGLVIGLAPMALTFAAERLCEQLGRDFVLGPRVAGLH